MGKIKDIPIGTRFGKWTVISKEGVTRNKQSWNCVCECKRVSIVTGTSLRRGESSQCTFCRNKNNGSHGFEDPSESSFNGVYYNYRRNAKTRGREFTLSKTQFKKITQQPCYYCAIPPSNKYLVKGSREPYIYNGVDRLDNSEGYVKGNILPCCEKHNTAKGSASATVILRAAAMLILKLFPASDKA